MLKLIELTTDMTVEQLNEAKALYGADIVAAAIIANHTDGASEQIHRALGSVEDRLTEIHNAICSVGD